MRYAIISDVHANLEALNAVLEKTEEEKVDGVLFLGDSVGYGPSPNECTEILKDKAQAIIAGNHDRAVAGMCDIRYFNPYAAAAIKWTRDIFSSENMDFLKALPLTQVLTHDSIFLVHGTPREPRKWHYLFNEYDAAGNFPFFREKICLAGHSHVPVIIERLHGGRMNVFYSRTDIREESRYIINAGSVGQPRDGNPDAAYVLLSDNTVEIKRVSYDILLTQKKMRKAGLPEYLIDRLSLGR